MGSIATSDPAVVEGICIKCGACIKRCPAGAKRFIDAEYLRHLAILERNFASIRREPQLFW
jgi:Predicted ATPase, RNase L inhibitor (RLI) homolog